MVRRRVVALALNLVQLRCPQALLINETYDELFAALEPFFGCADHAAAFAADKSF